MANTTKTSDILAITYLFADGDTRTVNYDNPRSNLTAAEIHAHGQTAVGVLIGDKTGAECIGISKATTTQKTILTLDLTSAS